MDDQRLGAAFRAVRIRAGRRQRDVAADAGVSASTVSRLERGHLGALTVATIRAVAAALDVRIELLPRSRNADLDRVASGAHAALAEAVITWFAEIPATPGSDGRASDAAGWVVRPEVSFSHYGERGVIDLLAWHQSTRSSLVIELKTDIVDVGEILGTLDRKVRNAARVAAGLGWQAETVSALLIVGESDTNRRKHALLRATFAAALPEGVVRVRRWLRQPSGTLRGQMFFADHRHGHVTARFTAVRRVRRRSRHPPAPR